jgi:pimeloyl-ACP methyl ester carboxylesterase
MMTSPSAVPMPHVDGVSHREVEANGTRFHVAEAGAGPPVLLLHGWPQHWYAWRKVIPLLATDHRVIAPDLRGFGWSEVRPGDFSKQALADDIPPLLDALELDRVDLIAHDWGAWASFILVLDHPERFGHYLALNMYAPWAAPPSPGGFLGIWRLWYQAALASPGLGQFLIRRTDFVKKMITTAAVHPDAWTPDDVESFAAVVREPERAAVSVDLYRTFLLRELVPYLRGGATGRRLTVPTLLLHGTKDLAIDPTRLGDWERWADDMRVELRDDSGHFIAEELPELVAERARALFAGTPAPAR